MWTPVLVIVGVVIVGMLALLCFAGWLIYRAPDESLPQPPLVQHRRPRSFKEKAPQGFKRPGVML